MGRFRALRRVCISKTLPAKKTTSLIDRRSSFQMFRKAARGQERRQKEGCSNLCYVLAACLQLCGVPFVLLPCKWGRPFASPCAVAGKVGLGSIPRLSHTASAVVGVGAELEECKGLPNGSVCFSPSVFVLPGKCQAEQGKRARCWKAASEVSASQM